MPLPFKSIEKGRDDMSFGAKADRRGQRLTGQHMCAIQRPVDHAVQQNFPVGLGFQGHKQAFVIEKALFVGNGQRRHVCQLDKAKGQLVFLKVKHLSPTWIGEGCGGRKGRGEVSSSICPLVSPCPVEADKQKSRRQCTRK